MPYLKSKILIGLLLLSLVCFGRSNHIATCKKENFFQSDDSCSTIISLYFPQTDVSTLNFYIELKSLGKGKPMSDCATLHGRFSCLGKSNHTTLDSGVAKVFFLNCTDEEFRIRYNQETNIPCAPKNVLNRTTTFLTKTNRTTYVTMPNGTENDSPGLSTEATIGLAVGIPTVLFIVVVVLLITCCRERLVDFRCKKTSNQVEKLSEGKHRQPEWKPFIGLLKNVAVDIDF